MKTLLPISLFVGWGWRRRGSGHLKIIIASNTAVCLLISEWVVKTQEEEEVHCDGLFVSVGRKPASQLVEGQLELDKNGYICADETTRTSIPGVYAVGDVRTKLLRQIVTAAADGAVSVHMAEEYLAAEK